VGAAYRAAGVVLNDHWPDMAREGFLSNRLFDAVAAGARVVSDDAEGLTEVFGAAVRVVSGPDQLAGVLAGPRDEIVGDDGARRAAADRVHAEHSFDARARALLASVLAARGG
jgi:spore maturation protein CgeB